MTAIKYLPETTPEGWNSTRKVFVALGFTLPQHPGYFGSDTHFAMDNFTFYAIPEPNTGLLLIAGLLGLAGWSRVRA